MMNQLESDKVFSYLLNENDKVLEVITKCKTKEQLLVAKNYVEKYIKNMVLNKPFSPTEFFELKGFLNGVLTFKSIEIDKKEEDLQKLLINL